MKWAITLDELKKSDNHTELYKSAEKELGKKEPEIVRRIRENENFSKYLDLYESAGQLKKTREFKEWYVQPIHKKFIELMQDRTAQLNYELFCGGWVQYHDTWILHGVVEHTIYFDWTEESGSIVAYLKTDNLSCGHPHNAQKDGGFINPPTSTDPPKPPGPPPPPTYR
jgi:hypothetical protein